MFICLGIFYSFHKLDETQDLLYTVLLPIPKRDAVTGKFLFSLCIQAAGLVLMGAFTAVRMTSPAGSGAYVRNVLMPANLVFLGFALLNFAAFNQLFVGGFFRSGGKLGRPFAAYLGASVVLMALGETLYRVPPLAFLRAMGGRELLYQLPLLAICAGVWIYVSLRAWRVAQTVFVKADL